MGVGTGVVGPFTAAAAAGQAVSEDEDDQSKMQTIDSRVHLRSVRKLVSLSFVKETP